MADVNNTDVRTATNASNTTRYFHLPLFIASDKPSWLVDWNGAMGDIDNILQDIATASEGAVADVATIQSQIDALNATIPNLEALVNTAVSDVAAMQTTVDSHETRMDNIEQDLITQNNLIKTLSDAVTTMQGTVATLNNRVQAMETSVSGLDTNVSAINTELSNIRNQISGLDTRVTALEQAQPGGGSGFPSIDDLGNTTKYTEHNISVAEAAIGNFTGTLTIPANSFFVIQTQAINNSDDYKGTIRVQMSNLGVGFELSSTTHESDGLSTWGNSDTSPLLKTGDQSMSFTVTGSNYGTTQAASGHLVIARATYWTPV